MESLLLYLLLSAFCQCRLMQNKLNFIRRTMHVPIVGSRLYAPFTISIFTYSRIHLYTRSYMVQNQSHSIFALLLRECGGTQRINEVISRCYRRIQRLCSICFALWEGSCGDQRAEMHTHEKEPAHFLHPTYLYPIIIIIYNTHGEFALNFPVSRQNTTHSPGLSCAANLHSRTKASGSVPRPPWICPTCPDCTWTRPYRSDAE